LDFAIVNEMSVWAGSMITKYNMSSKAFINSGENLEKLEFPLFQLHYNAAAKDSSDHKH
jgi:hypothetical protein